MAFPGTTQIDLSTAWSILRRAAGQVKAQCQAMIAAASVTRKQALDFANFLADSLATFDLYAGIPGMPAYAQQQANDPTLDIVAAYNAMRTQLAANQDWLVANFPKDAASNLAVFAFNGSKKYVDIALTAGELSAFRTQLSNLAATIN